MLKLYRQIEALWFRAFPQKVRFLLVGGFNSFAAFLIFVIFFMLLGNYTRAIVLQYIASVNISILTMRHYVFRGTGPFAKEYSKAVGVYLWMLFFNYVWLVVFIEALHLNPLVSQAAYLVVCTVMIYLLHKYFSFRKKIYSKF